MITETISYKNFNDEDDSFVMHFHISEAVLMENMTMRERLERLNEVLAGDARKLTMGEIQEILDIVKWIMSISYGIKSFDGKRFDQDNPAGSGQIWRDFLSTPAYSAFLMSLFRQPEKAVSFIVKVLPAELQADIAASADPAMQKVIADAQKATRLPSGTRIIDDVPVDRYGTPLTPTPTQPAAQPAVAPTDAEPDIDALMAQAWAEETAEQFIEDTVVKEPITLKRASFMASKLSPAQYKSFMEGYQLVDAEGNPIDEDGNPV